MKILHLCDSLNPAGLGGYESIIHYLSKTMAEDGHESFAVTQSPYQDSPQSVQKDHYTVFHLPGNLLEARKWEFFALPEAEREEAASKMFKSSDISENVEILTEQLSRLIHDLQPDVIHAHSIYVVFNKVITGMRLLNKLEIPVILTLHGLPKPLILPDGRKTTDYNELVSDFGFDQVIAVSEELEKKWDLAFMGRLEVMKSVDLFPEMLVLLKPNFPDLKMMMTGEGSLKEWLFNEFETRGVSSMVDYQGVVETDDVPRFINKSRIFLYPSREEPFGLSIIEAMACGVPVVSTDVYGPKEIIKNNYDGITVPPDNVVALAGAIEKLLEDDKIRAMIIENGIKSVKNKFDIKNHARQLLKIYRELIVRSP
jgi:glycosyltransferase involved in cell wall biosynthesis